MNVIPQLAFLILFLCLYIRLLQIHDILNMFLLQVWRGHFCLISSVRPIAHIITLFIDLVIIVNVSMNIQRSIHFFLLLHIFVLQCVWIDCHLVVDHIDVTLPPLLVLVQIIQKLLIVSITFAHFLLLFVIASIVALANSFTHHLIVFIHIYVTSEPFNVNNLTLTFLTDIMVAIEELLLRTNVLLSPAFFF